MPVSAKYIYGAVIAGVFLILGTLLGKGCSEPTLSYITRDSLIYRNVTARPDTVYINQYFPVAKGTKVIDTVHEKAPCSDFTFDVLTNGIHVAGLSNCMLTQIENLHVWGQTTVIVHDTTIVTKVVERESVTLDKPASALALSGFGESNILQGFSLADANFGLSGSLTFGNLSIYAAPQYGINNGLSVEAGLSVVLYQK